MPSTVVRDFTPVWLQVQEFPAEMQQPPDGVMYQHCAGTHMQLAVGDWQIQLEIVDCLMQWDAFDSNGVPAWGQGFDALCTFIYQETGYDLTPISVA